MATNKNAWAICDICGFRYRHKELKKNSYNLLVCPTDFEGAYDLKNHPQNKASKMGDKISIKDPRVESFNERNKVWELVDINWEDITSNWNNY